MSAVAELIERLRSHMGKQDVPVLLADCRLAADALEASDARAEELQKALAPLIAAYVALSGKQNDGFWNADAEPIVVTARRALSHTLTEEGKP